jgi:hypothetical protein
MFQPAQVRSGIRTAHKVQQDSNVCVRSGWFLVVHGRCNRKGLMTMDANNDKALTVEMLPRYLGDGVYASFDGYHVWLAVNDHNNKVVALEPEVFEALVSYVEGLNNLRRAQS